MKRAGAGDLYRLQSSGAFLHFLDSLACLFFGGAHFKHIVSTEGERERIFHQTPCCIGAQTQDYLLACDRWFLVLGTLQVLFHQFGRNADNVLTLPVLDHIERLQGADDVTLCDAGHLAEEKSGEDISRKRTECTCVCT